MEVPDQRVVAAFIAILIGSILILLEGIAWTSGHPAPIGLSQAHPDNLQPLGGLGITLGLILLGLGLVLRFGWDHRRTETGILVLILAAASLASGGGFLVGMALCLTGGLLAVSTPKGPHFVLVPSTVDVCPRCGTLNAAGATNCRDCGELLGGVPE